MQEYDVPHHNWREIHQSLMLFIQLKYILSKRSGTNLTSPSSTAFTAGFANGSILQTIA